MLKRAEKARVLVNKIPGEVTFFFFPFLLACCLIIAAIDLLLLC